MATNHVELTNAEDIRVHTRKFLSDGKNHSVQEIKSYVEKESGKLFTNGHYAGALRDLVKKEVGYESAGRGMYRYDASKEESKKDLARCIKDILQRIEQILYDEIGNVNLLDASDDDIETSTKVKSIIKYLKEKSKEF